MRFRFRWRMGAFRQITVFGSSCRVCAQRRTSRRAVSSRFIFLWPNKGDPFSFCSVGGSLAGPDTAYPSSAELLTVLAICWWDERETVLVVCRQFVNARSDCLILPNLATLLCLGVDACYGDKVEVQLEECLGPLTVLNANNLSGFDGSL